MAALDGTMGLGTYDMHERKESMRYVSTKHGWRSRSDLLVATGMKVVFVFGLKSIRENPAPSKFSVSLDSRI